MRSTENGCPSFLAQQPLRSDNSIEISVVAALDTLHDFLSSKRPCLLLLRFAYIQLTWMIDAYKAVAATDWIQGKVNRSVGQRDASVAIDLYLVTKREVPDEEMKRSQVSGYCRTGRLWTALAGRSPLLVCIFPPIADTIVYVPRLLPSSFATHCVERQNNSIRDSTVRNICGSIERDHPDLVQIMIKVATYAGLGSSDMAQTKPSLEDVVTKTHQALSSADWVVRLEHHQVGRMKCG